jgi:hypothetical protein
MNYYQKIHDLISEAFDPSDVPQRNAVDRYALRKKRMNTATKNLMSYYSNRNPAIAAEHDDDLEYRKMAADTYLDSAKALGKGAIAVKKSGAKFDRPKG